MSLTVAEANAAHRLVRCVLGQVPADDAARDAAVLLAERAARALHTPGISADDIHAAWPPRPRRRPVTTITPKDVL